MALTKKANALEGHITGSVVNRGMKLDELFLGDDGGVGARLQGAIDKLRSIKASNQAHEDLISDTISAINSFLKDPAMVYDDPHTLIATVSKIQNNQDEATLRSVRDTLNSYEASD